MKVKVEIVLVFEVVVKAFNAIEVDSRVDVVEVEHKLFIFLEIVLDLSVTVALLLCLGFVRGFAFRDNHSSVFEGIGSKATLHFDSSASGRT